MKVAVLFDNLGPYHAARLRAATSKFDLVAIQFGSSSAEYAWEHARQFDFEVLSVNPTGGSRDLSTVDFGSRLDAMLASARPDVVVVPGWSGRGAFAAISWCVRTEVPSVMMSESTAWDEPRVAWREAVKRKIVGLASAALAGGTPQAAYLRMLGMPGDRIFLGYDIVDNDYFSIESSRSRNSDVSKPHPYFLSSNRFVEKKNLFRLLDAYATYVGTSPDRRSDRFPWDLCMLGDGELKPRLLVHCQKLGLHAVERAPWGATPDSDISPRMNGTVFFPGFRQIDELPRYYGHAGAFVHASTTEQWGLVVNEAMASGLPVIVSNRVGCAQDLVEEGVNGFTFDPRNMEQLAQILARISALEFPLSAFGAASVRRVSAWGPDRFATGLEQACLAATNAKLKHAGAVERALLHFLLRK